MAWFTCGGQLGVRYAALVRKLAYLILVLSCFIAQPASATNFTMNVPGTALRLPTGYPEAGGVAIVLVGVNGNAYYQFSDPSGAFVGYQNTGFPSAFRGNPFTINSPVTLNCGFSDCSIYFGGAIAQAYIRFTALDGDTQVGGFDYNDITLRINGYDVANWSTITTQSTNTAGTIGYSTQQGFGNNTFDTGWFTTTNSALLANILSNGYTSAQVYDRDPNDNYWDFSQGSSLTNTNIRTVAPGYTLTKVPSSPTFTATGQQITYTYTITNIGSVPIRNLSVTDNKIGTVSCPTTTILDVNPGQIPNVSVCTATYDITQADFDSERVTNIAQALGTPDFGSLGTLTATATVTGPTISPSIGLTKSTTLSAFGAPGTTVPYNFRVQNTGNATLTNVVVTDPKLPGLSCSFATLLPGAVQNCQATYVVTQADQNAFANGTLLSNTATVTSRDPKNTLRSASSTVNLPGPTPVLTMTFDKSTTSTAFSTVGEVIPYQIAITNTGNITWPSAPAVTDTLTSVSCPAGSVAPGASITCQANYTVLQTNIDAGTLSNTASATITVGSRTATGTDTVSIPANRTVGLTLDKRLSLTSPTSFSTSGAILTYVYELRNTGNVTLNTIAVSDDRVSVTCPSPTLAPNTSLICTSDNYSTTQGNVNQGGVTNTATATATEAGTGANVASNTDSVTVPATQLPGLTLTKTAPTLTPAQFVEGAVVTYQYSVQNTGNTRIDAADQITITDDRIGTFNCGAGNLNRNAIRTCTADYTLTASDILAGIVVNVAVANAGSTESNTDTAQISPTLSPALTVVKSADVATVDATTDLITYTFTVTNSGNNQIIKSGQLITVNDPMVGSVDCSAQPAFLNASESFDCSATYSPTQAQLDAGEVRNTATASYPFSSGGVITTITSPSSTEIVDVVETASLTLAKTGPLSFTAVGQVLPFTFEVTNVGNTTLTSAVVTDPLIPGLSCNFTNIAPLATQSCSGNYTVTQADMNAGVIDNIAAAQGQTAQGGTANDTDTASVPVDGSIVLKAATFDKIANTASFSAVGDTIVYTMAVTNTGAQTLSNIAVTDALDAGYSCTIPSLLPGASNTSCTFSHIVTQADIDAGQIINSAEADSPGFLAPLTGSVTIPGPVRNAAYSFSKVADGPYLAKDDIVTFTLAVTNTGNVTLSNVQITDNFFVPAVSCTVATLLPGQSDNSCTASYTILQSDVDNGQITNTASISGAAPAGVASPATTTATAVVSGPVSAPAITISKTPSATTYSTISDTITYDFAVTNTGNVTLTGLVVNDPQLSFSCGLDDLAPGATATTCSGGAPALSASKSITQAEIDLGTYSNTVTVDGQSLVGAAPVSALDSVTVIGPIQDPDLTISKASTLVGSFNTLGQAIPYEYTVSNSGNVTLTGTITVADDKITSVSCPALLASGLPPGSSIVCTGTYNVTQADLDAGFVTNNATASTTQVVIPANPGDPSVKTVTSAPDQETVSAQQLPALSLDKRIKASSASSYLAINDPVTYEYVVTNTGNVTTTSPVTIADDKITGTLTCAPAGLAPGASATCEQIWTADQQALDDGEVTNTAIASTSYGAGTIDSNSDQATITAVQTASLSLTKNIVAPIPTNFDVGEVLNYQYIVTNNGNVTISGVTLSGRVEVTDNLTPVTCPAMATIAPSGTMTCTASYTLTANDISIGSTTNIATATGVFEGATVASPQASAIFPVLAIPAINLEKATTSTAFATLGQVITYDFTITNPIRAPGQSGVGLIEDVFITDDKIGTFLCRSASEGVFSVGDTHTCSQSYSVTQADLDLNSLTNNAVAQTIFARGTLNEISVASAPDSVSIPGGKSPELTVTKAVTSGPATASVGDTLGYTITATNSGNQTISGVTLTDPKIGALSCTLNGSAAPANVILAPSQSLICTGSYQVVQTDLDTQPLINPVLTNIAVVRGSDPQGATVTGSGTIDHPLVNLSPAVLVTKAITPEPGADDAFVALGQAVTFVVTVQNVGNVTLSSTTVTDDLVAGNCLVGALAPSQSDSSCSFIYTVTQADIDALNGTPGSFFGGFVNTATGVAQPANPGSSTVTDDGSVFAKGPAREPALALSKIAQSSDFSAPSDSITYEFTVANTGNVTLTAPISVTDFMLGGTFNCGSLPAGGLPPGEFVTCTASYNVTQADVDAGFVTNVATVESSEVPLPSNPADQGPMRSSVTVNGTRNTGVSINKQASISSNAALGDRIDYTYTVTNTGNVTLTNVTADDQHTSAAGTVALSLSGDLLLTDNGIANDSTDAALDGVWDSLAPGDVAQFTASYVVTQSDIDEGNDISNVVTVTGQGPSGTIAPEATDQVDVAVIAELPLIEALKTVDLTGLSTPPIAGEVLDYTVRIANRGNVTLHNLALSDRLRRADATPLTLASGPSYVSGNGGDLSAMEVGEEWTYSASYTLTQADIDGGGVSNQVTVAATSPAGTEARDLSDDGLPGGTDDPTLVQIPANPAIIGEKTIVSGPIVVGGVVEFEITATNTGNVTLINTGVATDTLLRADSTPLTLTSAPGFAGSSLGSGAGILLPGEVATYRATYRLVQADIDAGGISNSAAVTGTPPVGSSVTDVTDNGNDADGNSTNDPTVLTTPSNPSLVLAKRLAAASDPVYSTVGQILTYEFEVTNTGNVTLTDPISINDPLLGAAFTCGVLPVGGLLPAQSLICTADYAVTQVNIDAGSIANTATASSGGTDSSPATLVVQAQQIPALTVLKEASPLPAVDFVTNAVVNYSYTVTNNGNVTLTAPISITDNRIDGASLSCPALPISGLAPGGSVVCSGTYTVVPDDVDLGTVTNIASATSGGTTSPIASETVPDAGVPALDIVKTAQAGATFAAIGDTIRYDYRVTNSGTRAFSAPVVVVDDRLGDITCYTPSTADPDFVAGEFVDCSATHTVTQADLDAGEIVNQAYSRTTYGGGAVEVVSDPDTVTVAANLSPGLSLTKTSSPNPASTLGQLITYQLTATNTGNQTLSNVQITDPLLPALSCTVTSLLPMQSLLCTGTYNVTQADIDRGSVTNTALATGITPQGNSVSQSAVEVTQMPAAAPALTLVKTATPSPFGVVGSVLTYRFSVTNSGNVTLTNLQVTDPLDAGYSCTIATLFPGETDTTCSLTITVTQDQVDAGQIVNTATVIGVDPFSTVVQATGSTSTTGPARVPGIEVTKTLLASASTLGSPVRYQLLVRNTGNVTLDPSTPVDVMTRLNGNPIALDAPFVLTSGDGGTVGRLDVGETWIYTAAHTLTQFDINAGGLRNSATVTAAAPGVGPVSDVSDDGNDADGNTADDPTEFLIASAPALEVTKTISSTTGSNVGNQVIFTINAVNTGNVTLDQLGIVDTLTRADGSIISGATVTGGATSLAPGASADWTLTHVLTQADIDAGGLENTAVGTGTAPDGSTVSDRSSDGDNGDGNVTDDPTVLTISPQPELIVVKQLDSIGSQAGEEAVFTITATNSGNVTLTNVAVSDQLSRIDGSTIGAQTPQFVSNSAGSPQGTLGVGEVATWRLRYTLTVADIDAGGISNTAQVNSTSPTGALISDVSDDDGSGASDPTLGLITAAPSFGIVKSAGSPEFLFPTIQRVTFTLEVTNTGNVTQTGIQVADNLASFLAPAILAPSYPVIVRASGFGAGAPNPAYDGIGNTDTLAGDATLAPGSTGQIEIELVYVGQPTGANTGTVTSDQLTDPTTSNSVTIDSTDSDGDGIPDLLEGGGDRDGDGVPNAQDYDPTGTFYCQEDGRILSGGQVSVTGPLGTQTGTGSSGGITIVRDGSDGRFQFYVTEVGSYTLALTYPPSGTASTTRPSAGTLDVTTLLPANPGTLGSGETGSTGRLADFSAGANTFYTTFVVEAGDPYIINNNIPMEACAGTPDVSATKTADRTSAVFGETINFTLVFENNTSGTYSGAQLIDMLPDGLVYTPGSGLLDGTATEPSVSGNRLSWGPVTLAPAQRATVRLAVRVSAGASIGKLLNRSWLEDAAGTVISNVATATIKIVPEAVFDCTDIIGKVFDDRNHNGYPDGPAPRGLTNDDVYQEKYGKLSTPKPEEPDYEPGLPGVRLATVNGLLITTDEFGRFHVPCAALPKKIGSNFALKLDPRTLPTGYRVTTENPRVIRVTPGKVAKMNFGAALSDIIDIDLTSAAYHSGSTQPKDGFAKAVDGLVAKIKAKPTALRLTYLLRKGEDPAGATARLKAAETIIRRAWRSSGRYKLDIERAVKRVQ